MSNIAEIISNEGVVNTMSDFKSQKEFEYKILNSLEFETIKEFFIKKSIIDAVKQNYAHTSRNIDRTSFDDKSLLQYFKTKD